MLAAQASRLPGVGDDVFHLADMTVEVHEFVGGSVIGFVVETSCKYEQPIAFPDAVQCGLRVTRIGTSSMRFEVGLFRNDEPLTDARGYFVLTGVPAGAQTLQVASLGYRTATRTVVPAGSISPTSMTFIPVERRPSISASR